MAGKNGELPVGTLEQILATGDVANQTKLVEMPEWGCSIRLRGLTWGEYAAMAEMSLAEVEAYALSIATVEPVLTREQAATLIATKSAGSIRQFVRELMDLSGLGESFRA